MTTFVNIAAYRFVELPKCATELKKDWLPQLNDLALKGTILLSDSEGININLAGESEPIAQFIEILEQYPQFTQLSYRRSLSTAIPYEKMLIKVKKQIIPFAETVNPKTQRGASMDPLTLKQWLDEKRDFTLLDARNDYEIAVGKFQVAQDCQIENFRDLQQQTAALPADIKQKPLVTYCTGGIRCEKVVLMLKAQGFSEVYQLEGGIFNYFEQVGSAHYQGNCFVFDDRGGIKPDLSEV